MMKRNSVTVIGAGLAGCEAAWTLANHNVNVTLCEMKPQKYTPAHKYSGFAELVCSNSLKADRLSSAAGLLKAEMRLLGSLLLECAEKTKVPAGGALAVDRGLFSDFVTERINAHPLIKVVHQETFDIPAGYVVIATGPLTSDAFADRIKSLVGGDYLSFYDAASPIISADSIDFDKVFFAARYDKGDADYINCPFNKEGYEYFHTELILAKKAELNSFDQPAIKVYEGCMPIEVMASRGIETLRFGPLKPVGLRDPKTGHRPWAVVQLRKEDADGNYYNLVGFQTNLKFGEQKRVFSLIPGLENAEFIRYGVMHRNTFIDSPRLLCEDFSLKVQDNIYFAGQITGVEGYMESAASGIVAAKNLLRKLDGKKPLKLPKETMIGALCRYISDETIVDFQPMGASMGLLPPLESIPRIKKQDRYQLLSERSLAFLKQAVELEAE